jgi:hypothetical protein
MERRLTNHSGQVESFLSQIPISPDLDARPGRITIEALCE